MQFLSLLNFEEHPNQSKPAQFCYTKTSQNSPLKYARFSFNLFSNPILLMLKILCKSDIKQRGFISGQVFFWFLGFLFCFGFVFFFRGQGRGQTSVEFQTAQIIKKFMTYQVPILNIFKKVCGRVGIHNTL